MENIMKEDLRKEKEMEEELIITPMETFTTETGLKEKRLEKVD
jgi:hypothetical protein